MPEIVQSASPASGSPLPKFAVVMGILGVVNALAGFAITCYLNVHWPADRAASDAWDNIALWVWPAGLVMMAATNAWNETLFLTASVLTNGGIYFAVGLAIGSIWRRAMRHAPRRYDP
jgi:hypothetical protein